MHFRNVTLSKYRHYGLGPNKRLPKSDKMIEKKCSTISSFFFMITLQNFNFFSLSKFSKNTIVRFKEVIFHYGTVKSVRLNQVSALRCPL